MRKEDEVEEDERWAKRKKGNEDGPMTSARCISHGADFLVGLSQFIGSEHWIGLLCQPRSCFFAISSADFWAAIFGSLSKDAAFHLSSCTWTKLSWRFHRSDMAQQLASDALYLTLAHECV